MYIFCLCIYDNDRDDDDRDDDHDEDDHDDVDATV